MIVNREWENQILLDKKLEVSLLTSNFDLIMEYVLKRDFFVERNVSSGA